MTDEGRSPNLLTRLLVGMCLILLVANVVWDFSDGRLPEFAWTFGPAIASLWPSMVGAPKVRQGKGEVKLATASLMRELPAASGANVKPHRPALMAHRHVRRARPGHPQVQRSHSALLEVPNHGLSQAAPISYATPRTPERTQVTLKSLGYIERAEGRKVAVLPEGEHVALVPEGGVFADRYRAVEVSARSVTLLDQIGALVNQPLRQAIAAVATLATPKMPVPASLETISGAAEEVAPLNPEASGRLPASPVHGGKPFVLKAEDSIAPPAHLFTLKPLGYIEQAGGRKIAVLPDGEHVALVPEGEVFANRYRAVEVSARSVTLLDQGGGPAGQSSPEAIAAMASAVATKRPESVRPIEHVLLAISRPSLGEEPDRPSQETALPEPTSNQDKADIGAQAAPVAESVATVTAAPRSLGPEKFLPGSGPEASLTWPLRNPPVDRLVVQGPPLSDLSRSRPGGLQPAGSAESIERRTAGANGPGEIQLLGIIETAQRQMEAVIEWGGEVGLFKEADVLPDGYIVSKISLGVVVARPGASILARSKEPKSPLEDSGRQSDVALVLTCCGYNSSRLLSPR